MAMSIDPAATNLSADEIRRYSRHLVLPEVGLEGQRAIKAAQVLCVGAGGLGSPVSMYLAAAGVGTPRHRGLRRRRLQQPAATDPPHGRRDVGRPKIESATGAAQGDQPGRSRRDPRDPRCRSANALDLISHYDIVVDGTDNFPTRYLVNDACVLLGKPQRLRQHLPLRGPGLGVRRRRGPCYRCLYPEPPPPGLVPSCAEGGVLGVASRHHRHHPGHRGA